MLVTVSISPLTQGDMNDAADLYGERVRRLSDFALEIRNLTAEEADFICAYFASSYCRPHQEITGLAVTTSTHGMPCIDVHGVPPELLALIRGALSDDKTDFRCKAGAFLQGEYAEHGWMLVEFWSPDYQDFVNHLNHLMRNAIGRGSRFVRGGSQ